MSGLTPYLDEFSHERVDPEDGDDDGQVGAEREHALDRVTDQREAERLEPLVTHQAH